MKVYHRNHNLSVEELSESRVNSSFLNHEYFQVSSPSTSSKESIFKNKLSGQQKQRESQETRCSEFEYAFGINSISNFPSMKNIEIGINFKDILYSKINCLHKKNSVSAVSLIKTRKGSKFLQGLMSQLPSECHKILYSEVSKYMPY